MSNRVKVSPNCVRLEGDTTSVIFGGVAVRAGSVHLMFSIRAGRPCQRFECTQEKNHDIVELDAKQAA